MVTIVTPLSHHCHSLPSRQCQGAQQMRFGPAATTAEARAGDGPMGRWADGPGMGQGIGKSAELEHWQEPA